MFANPLGDIRLRSHHALPERTVPGELKRLFLAISGICDGTDGQDDFNQSVLHSKHGFVKLRPIHAGVSKFQRKISPLSCPESPHCRHNDTTSARELLLTGVSCPHLSRTIAKRGGVGSSNTSSARSFAASQPVLAANSIERLTKPPALTLDVSVQCFKNTLAWGFCALSFTQ